VGGVNWGTEFAEFLLYWMKPNNIFGAFALLGTEIAQKFKQKLGLEYH
jgi:energy-converting hydrogenase Eha subunit G